MYLPPQFEESRIDVLHGLMRTHPLATLVTLDGSEIVADHLPVDTLSAPAPFGLLRGHVARANPVWHRHSEGAPALAVFHGPQVYISPSLYPTKRESGAVVPTWDYAVVHARGVLKFVDDAAWLRGVVAEFTETHEAPRSPPWQVDDAPRKYLDQMLAQIVGFEFHITRLTGKWKVSQNRSAADRQGVIAGLGAATDENSQRIAELLSERHS